MFKSWKHWRVDVDGFSSHTHSAIDPIFSSVRSVQAQLQVGAL